MKKNASYLALLALVGCAGSPQHTSENFSGPIVLPASSQPQVVWLKEGDRTPASTPVIQWNPTVIPVEIRGNHEQKSLVVTVNQEMSWTESEPYNDVKMEYREVEVPSTCAELLCTSTGGAGKSENWNRFYNASGVAAKAQALADAIVGVGVPSAQALIANRYFSSKPRSWDDFAAEIRRAAVSGVIRQSVVTEVIYNHRMENALALGYGQDSCREVVRSCSVWQSKLVAIPFINYRKVTKKRLISSRQFNVDITIKGAKLLSFEKDNLQIAINEDGKMLDNDGNGGLNRYTFTTAMDEKGHLVIDGTATTRIQRDLPSNIVRQDSYTLVGTEATFVLDVDPALIPGQEDPDAQLVVDYTVQNCEYGWTGTCGLGFSSWKNFKVASQQIKEGRTVIATGLPVHNHGQVVYTVTRRNSVYFSNKSTSSRETESLKMPRR